MHSQRAMGEYPMLSPRKQRSQANDDYLLSIHVLDGAKALPEMALEDLPLVAQTLSAAGSVVIVEYDEADHCLKFYSQDAWLRAGRLVARRNDHRIARLSLDAGGA